jgi:ATP-dependent DNA helicase RecG
MAEHPVKPVSCRGRYFTRTGNPQREERWDYPMHALTVEKIKSGQYKSHLRNKQIATIFHELNLIEKYGSGVRRVIDSFVAYGLPEPTFEATQGGLAVTVYKASSPQSGGVSGGVNSAAANLEAQLLVLVQNTPGLNAVGLSHQTNTPLRTVQRQLKQLTAKGLLAFKGAPKTGGYWPTPLPNACEDKK